LENINRSQVIMENFMAQKRESIMRPNEAGEVPLPMQAKLLRAIQERDIQWFGSDTVLYADVRIIAATNKYLLDAVKEGKFREDLYCRLNVVTVEVPSLKERSDDIPLLAKYFLGRHAEKNRKNIMDFTPLAMACLSKHDCPGNVRELENAIERAVVLSTGNYITERELPPIVT
jgi:two-component system response regulator HydG